MLSTRNQRVFSKLETHFTPVNVISKLNGQSRAHNEQLGKRLTVEHQILSELVQANQQTRPSLVPGIRVIGKG